MPIAGVRPLGAQRVHPSTRLDTAQPKPGRQARDVADTWAQAFARRHPPLNRTERFHALMADRAPGALSAPRATLRGTVVVVVRGYLAEAYRACGRGYLDAQIACCQMLGARVLVGRVSGCRTAGVNSAELFAQLMAETQPDDKVLLIAHSHGTLAALEILCNPAYAALQGRMAGFIAINGVFGGTPVADLWAKAAYLKGADWLLDRSLHAMGGERGVLREMRTRCRSEYLQAKQDEIARMLQRLPVLCLATHFRWPVAPWDMAGMAMQPYRMFMQRRGLANDGCVPVASQILPGAPHVILDNMHHAQTIDDLGGGVCLQAMTQTLLQMLPEGAGGHTHGARAPELVPPRCKL